MRKLLEKWNKMPDATKSSIAFMMSSFIARGISFLVTPIFTRIIPSEQYGIITTYNSWVSIIEVFAVLGLTSAGVFNVGMKDHKEDRDQFISSILILCNITTVAVFGIIFILKIPFGENFILPPGLLIVMLIHFLFNPATIFWITRQRYEYKYKLPFIITLVSNVLAQTVSIICLLNIETPNQGSLRIWTNTISLLFVQVPVYIILLKRGKTYVSIPIWKDTLVFSLPLIPHYLAQHVMASSDRIMISNLYSNTGAAIYGVVANISMISTIIWNAVNASLIPYTYEKVEQNRSREINKIVIPLLLFYATICVGVTLIAPEILMILAPEEYYGGIYAVPPIASMVFVSALYSIYANIEFYHKKSKNIAVCTIVAASTNVGLNYIFIPMYGYVAASYTTLISEVILVIMHYIGSRKCHKDNFYNDTVIFGITVILIGACLVCNLLYANIYLRYSIVLVILLILVFKRKYIINKYQEIKNK